MGEPATPADLIGLTEAAQMLGISRWTLRRMIDRGEVTGYRVGRLVKVSARDVRRIARPMDGGESS